MKGAIPGTTQTALSLPVQANSPSTQVAIPRLQEGPAKFKGALFVDNDASSAEGSCWVSGLRCAALIVVHGLVGGDLPDLDPEGVGLILRIPIGGAEEESVIARSIDSTDAFELSVGWSP